MASVPESHPVSAQDLLRWSESLSAIARTGLGFTKSLYEQERFEEVLKVAADIRVAAGHELEAEVLVEEWLKIDLQPLFDEHLGLELVPGGDAYVRCDLQHLFEALLLVEALGEPQPGAGDRRQALAPPQQILSRDGMRLRHRRHAAQANERDRS